MSQAKDYIFDVSDLKLYSSEKTAANNTPTASGVYFFIDENKNVLYIGKAKNVKNRLSSYYLPNLHGKTKIMVEKSKFIAYIKVESEIESLLLEAKLIRREKPPYNLELRDDKKPLYIRISDEKYPRVLTARRIDQNKRNQVAYGPFPSSKNVNQVLKNIRKIFPYSTHKLGKRACLYSQIGLCDPCPNLIEKSSGVNKEILTKIYLKNIYYIKKFLNGDFIGIKSDLQKEMKKDSDKEDYEAAHYVKEKLDQIEYITQPVRDTEEYVKNPNLIEDIRKNEITELENILVKYFVNIRKIKRIECYDVSHLQGNLPTASMITFINGEPDKSLYRRFKIRGDKKNSDTDSLREVAKRRSEHFEDWGKPDLIIVDGGRGQVSSFFEIFKESFPIVGIAKRQEILIIPEVLDGQIVKHRQKKLRAGPLHLVQRLRDEAHRFSRSYHHKLIEKQLVGN